MSTKTSAALFIDCLEARGVQYVFGVPWEENLDLLESLRTSSIRLIVTRNEQTAVFMAATYGRLTWKVGVALATLGPWATNMMTWVAYAQLWGLPVLVVTGQKPIKHSKQWRFQVIDVVAMMTPVTKYSTSIVDGSRVPSIVHHACTTAESEKPWAVHIELAEDIAGEAVPVQYKPIISETLRRPIPDEKAIQRLLTRLSKAKKPMILVGAWANRKRITKFLTLCIEKYNIPFFTSQMGKWVVDERLPQCMWAAALTTNDHIHAVIDKADLILAIWHDTIEKPTHVLEEDGTALVHINFTPAQVDQLYAPDLQIIGDIGHTMRRVYEADIDTSGWDLTDVYEAMAFAKKQLRDFADAHYDSDVMMPARLVDEVRKVMWEADIVALDNGLYKVRFARNYPTYLPNTLLLDNALATMWAWYSSAMMAKILHPEKNVIAVVGDGWLVMNLWDVETMVRLQLDIVILVLNDYAYGMIKWKQHNHGYEDFGLDLQNPDFVRLAEAFGAKWHLLDDVKSFGQQLAHIVATPGVHIVEIPFAYPTKIQ